MRTRKVHQPQENLFCKKTTLNRIQTAPGLQRCEPADKQARRAIAIWHYMVIPAEYDADIGVRNINLQISPYIQDEIWPQKLRACY